MRQVLALFTPLKHNAADWFMLKIKQKDKKQPKLDMNPMTDLAFLLVTFFMLTTTFKAEEPVTINNPAATTEIKLPEQNILTITIANDGRVFFGLDGQFTRERLIDFVNQRYNLNLSEKQRKTFSLLNTFGLPVSALSDYLNLPTQDRKTYTQPGIPVDSTSNELAEWIVYSRMINPNLRVAINGDTQTKYPTVKKVISTLVNNKVTRFNLITDKEQALQDG